jgi:agmatinase
MITVLGAPLDDNSSFMRGPAQAPDKIREAFHSDAGNYFTESGLDLSANTGWKDGGNIELMPKGAAIGMIEKAISESVGAGDKVFLLGGDHSVSFPSVKALHNKYGKLTIFHIDAHPDLYDNFNNNPHSHASPFARIMEAGLASRLVQVGIRTMNKHQREQAERFGVEIIEMKNWRDHMELKADGPSYLSFDLDAIDPGFAPGLSHHEPGGFTPRQAISIIQNLKGHFVGADLVELNPDRDVNGITATLAAKLFKEILDLLLLGGKK